MSRLVPPHLMNLVQCLELGLDADRAATVDKVIVGQPQRHVVLEDLTLDFGLPGLVTDVTLCNTSLMASDQGCNIYMFHPEACVEGFRSIGLPFPRAQNVVVKATLAGVATLAGSVGTQVYNGEDPPDVSRHEGDLSVYFGLGAVSVPSGATARLEATCVRDCTLGPLFLDIIASGSLIDLMIEDISVNKKPLLTGRSDTTYDRVPLRKYSYLSTDLDGRVLAFKMKVNDKIVITIRNYNPGPQIVYGGCFCLNEGDAGEDMVRPFAEVQGA